MSILNRKVIAVIGGANGIGREISRQLAAAGSRVAIGDRDGATATEVAAELPGETIASTVDVTSPESIEKYLVDIEEKWGRIDGLINSAGIMSVGPFEEESTAATRAQLDVNLFGAIDVIKAIAPRMRRARSGRIIVLASAASLLPTPGEATYSASKHGVYGYLKAVRAELRKSRVYISVVMPTVVDTELAAGTSSGAAALLQPADVARTTVQTLIRPRFEVPIPRYLGVAHRAIEILPLRLRDAVYRRLVPDQVQSADPVARAKYEEKKVSTEAGE